MALENNCINASSRMSIMCCRSELFLLALDNYAVKIIWIPAHSGIVGNEKADHLAKNAVLNSPLRDHSIEWHNFIGPLKYQLLRNWQHRWDKGDLGRFCYSIIPRVKLKAWYRKFDGDLTSAELRCVSRLSSNHYTLKSHLHRVNIVESPLCECGAYETIDHILFSCVNYMNGRVVLQNYLRRNGHIVPFEIRNILASSTSAETVKIIYNFLKENDVKF